MQQDDLIRRLDAAEARLRNLEDIERIRQLLAEYGFNADLGRVAPYLADWADDCEYEQGVGRSLKGKQQLRSIIETADSPHKRLLENRSQHLIANLVIRVTGDTAWAEGYSFVLFRKDETNAIWSCAYNQWDFGREGEAWKIIRRRRRAIGDDGSGTDVIHRYLEQADHGPAQP